MDFQGPLLSNSTSENSLSRLAGSRDFSRDSDKGGRIRLSENVRVLKGFAIFFTV